MRRIWIRGTSGSGKSTLARAISNKLHIEHVELDNHWHLPGWQVRPLPEFLDRVDSATQGDTWVVEGNYRRAQPIVSSRADTLIWLDYPFAITFIRVLMRTIRRRIRREVVCNGNVESLRKSLFTRESILWWVIITHRRRHRECEDLFASALVPGVERLRFRHPRETKAWLDSLN